MEFFVFVVVLYDLGVNNGASNTPCVTELQYLRLFILRELILTVNLVEFRITMEKSLWTCPLGII